MNRPLSPASSNGTSTDAAAGSTQNRMPIPVSAPARPRTTSERSVSSATTSDPRKAPNRAPHHAGAAPKTTTHDQACQREKSNDPRWSRSEERRVGKECRSERWTHHKQKKGKE